MALWHIIPLFFLLPEPYPNHRVRLHFHRFREDIRIEYDQSLKSGGSRAGSRVILGISNPPIAANRRWIVSPRSSGVAGTSSASSIITRSSASIERPCSAARIRRRFLVSSGHVSDGQGGHCVLLTAMEALIAMMSMTAPVLPPPSQGGAAQSLFRLFRSILPHLWRQLLRLSAAQALA